MIEASISTGKLSSVTVTIAVQFDMFPAPSVTVKITVLSPSSVQSKDVLSRLSVGVPQLSWLPLSISSVVIVAFPEASS